MSESILIDYREYIKKPKRVERCVTHHHACECNQWRYEQLEMALKIIHTWASFCISPDNNGFEQPVDVLNDIKNKAINALRCLDTKNEVG